jgi:hypothetical protein
VLAFSLTLGFSSAIVALAGWAFGDLPTWGLALLAVIIGTASNVADDVVDRRCRRREQDEAVDQVVTLDTLKRQMRLRPNE